MDESASMKAAWITVVIYEQSTVPSFPELLNQPKFEQQLGGLFWICETDSSEKQDEVDETGVGTNQGAEPRFPGGRSGLSPNQDQHRPRGSALCPLSQTGRVGFLPTRTAQTKGQCPLPSFPEIL